MVKKFYDTCWYFPHLSLLWMQVQIQLGPEPTYGVGFEVPTDLSRQTFPEK